MQFFKAHLSGVVPCPLTTVFKNYKTQLHSIIIEVSYALYAAELDRNVAVSKSNDTKHFVCKQTLYTSYLTGRQRMERMRAREFGEIWCALLFYGIKIEADGVNGRI